MEKGVPGNLLKHAVFYSWPALVQFNTFRHRVLLAVLRLSIFNALNLVT